MAVKALMVDVDGVVIRHPAGRRWDTDLEADLGVSPPVLQRAFFAPHFSEVVLGRADLHDRLAPVLARIAPHLTSQDLVAYWFARDSVLDQTLLDDLAACRAAGLGLHLATVQEHHRARHLWETLGLNRRFDAMHYAADYGCAKPDPAFFHKVEARTGFVPEELVLIDDRAANVDAARACGWGAVLWTGEQRLDAALSTLT